MQKWSGRVLFCSEKKKNLFSEKRFLRYKSYMVGKCLSTGIPVIYNIT